jgi:hypothetical protein
MAKKTISNGIRASASGLLGTLLYYLQNRSPLRLLLDLFFIIMVTICLAGGWIVSINFNQIFFPNKLEAEHLQNTIQQNKEIEIILQKTLEQTGASRAYLYKFHDGTVGVNGISFFYISNTVEVVSPGISHEILNEQRIPISLTPGLETLNKNECITVMKIESNSLYFYHASRSGTVAFSLCPVYDLDNSLVGFIGVDYVGQFPVKTKEDIEVINRDSSRLITGALVAR